MIGDLTAGRLHNGQDALSGDPVPSVKGRTVDTEEFGQLGRPANNLGGASDGGNLQGGGYHPQIGKSQLPSPSTNNYGAEGNGTLHIELMDKDSLGSRLRKAREEAKLSQSAIAKEFKITRNAVSLWENDTNAPTTDKISRIAALTGVSTEYLLSGTEPKNVQKNEIPHPFEMPRDVPVEGIAACGEDGAFVFESTTIDYVRRPPRIKGLPDVYAIYVQGSSMSPWRESGDPVYVNPRQPVQIMDFVLVQTGSGGKPTAAYVKRLIRRTASEIRLKQYEPAEEIVIPTRKIISIHRIMDWPELLGL
jgi:phage repressor protein C with HTH and peptisase S24 domain